MPRVRSYTRRDGTRVRGHYRSRTRRFRPRRPYARRRRAAGRAPDRSGWWLGGTVGGLVLAWLVVDFVQRQPVWSLVIAVAVLAAGATIVVLLVRARFQVEADAALRARRVEATDTMTGAEFEDWVAALLRRSGFSRVAVCGGAADRGADITAISPDGRRIVVQCKRHSPANRVGSAAVQRFAGTCRSIHRGEICVIVTNGFFAAGDGLRLARELGIGLVDRSALGEWAYTGRPPEPLSRPRAR
ncbi:restriction endonuclease [Micromonospora sp. WMMD1102]|uniref:restriction endonuclease n=1 Tax=Micromonospora sp. WMMD1102 TaxID=3016105 RepID=UPI0024156828|nr:restriction endonuclease [Micromonospora sp. WMMD1102]MDG4787486.1 restriction endonuclease [Micromonospora sp. WMMD1102]